MPNSKKPAKPAAKKPVIKSAVAKPSKKAAKPKTVSHKPMVKSAKPAPKKAAVKAPSKPIKKAAPAAKAVVKNSTKLTKPTKPTSPLKKTTPETAPHKATPVKKATPAPVAHKPAVPAKAHAPAPAHPEPVASKKPELTPLPKAKDIKVAPPKPVVIPKIAHNKQRKYEPDFTKSVLDSAPAENNGPTQRYSDQELNEFRELIQRKLETAKKELGYLQGLITRKDEMGGDETDNRYMTMEDGSLSMEREQLSQMASRQITFIDHLEKAMMRIENKTYGICRVTGKLIDKARLRAVPHATLSIEAKMGINK